MDSYELYSEKWFTNWLLNYTKYSIFYNLWVESVFDSKLLPIVVRKNPNGKYEKGNLFVTTPRDYEGGEAKYYSRQSKIKKQYTELEIRNLNVKYENNKEKIKMSVNYLVVVESASKARTIAGFLGSEYAVKASFGHIRNIKKSYDFKNVLASGCNPEYENDKDKIKIIKELKDYINKDTIVYLASDEDREGEAISWHLIETLKLDPAKTKRIAFHEITKPAILHALANPRRLDIPMVNAQKARQILDKGVGYSLSPILWQKVGRALAAGRVMSVAVRIIVDRENEIRSFVPEEFWKFKALFQNPEFKAELSKKDGKVIKMEISNAEIANAVEKDLLGGEWVLTDIEEKDSFRNPQPPFATSTLQQIASTKLGFSVDNTMKVAQQLYEGNIRGNIPNHKGGLITYMRTDSLNLSTIALDAIKVEIANKYGKEYTIPNHRTFKSKSKGAQEAHEAIRPTNVSLHPDMIAPYLDDYQLKLYRLIWNRTVATQMAPAKVAITNYKITAGVNKNYEFISKGNRIIFPGFLMLEDLKDDVVLPTVEKGSKLNLNKLDKEQSFTQAPARYTEATFVKKMEDLGIGRPSTYASTIATIKNRKYVELDKDKKLVPTSIGEATNKFLVENFPGIVDIGFTARMEEDLDRIAHGEIEWKSTVENFAKGFMADVAKNMDSKQNYREGRVIGIDPKTKLEIKAMLGKFGPYLITGNKADNNVKFAKIPEGKNMNDLTLQEAIAAFDAPKPVNREVEIDGSKGRLAIGKFGPYLAIHNKYYSIPAEDNYLTVSIDRLKEIIVSEDIKRENNKDKPKFKKWNKK